MYFLAPIIMDIGYYGVGRHLIELFNVIRSTELEYKADVQSGETADVPDEEGDVWTPYTEAAFSFKTESRLHERLSFLTNLIF